jgi:lysozyme family protein
MYSDKFNTVMAFILPHEEEFVRGHWGDERFVIAENVSGDSGGVTKYGVDQSSHPSVDVAKLTKAGAMGVYWDEWQQHGCEVLPAKYSYVFFDVWVNGGPAVKMLQQAVGATVDGYMGPLTIRAAEQAGDTGVVQFLVLRHKRYCALSYNRSSLRKFLAGWLDRNSDLATFVGVGSAYNKLIS